MQRMRYLSQIHNESLLTSLLYPRSSIRELAYEAKNLIETIHKRSRGLYRSKAQTSRGGGGGEFGGRGRMQQSPHTYYLIVVITTTALSFWHIYSGFFLCESRVGIFWHKASLRFVVWELPLVSREK